MPVKVLLWHLPHHFRISLTVHVKGVSEIQQTLLGDNLTKQVKSASTSTIASLLLSLKFPHYLGGAYVHRLSDVQLKL